MPGPLAGMETVRTRVGGDLTPVPSSSGAALSRACATGLAGSRLRLTAVAAIPASGAEQEVLVPVNLSLPATGGRATVAMVGAMSSGTPRARVAKPRVRARRPREAFVAG